jgi:hypothetical protein
MVPVRTSGGLLKLRIRWRALLPRRRQLDYGFTLTTQQRLDITLLSGSTDTPIAGHRGAASGANTLRIKRLSPEVARHQA